MGCIVEDLGAYKVAWLRVDTQTILTIANHVITKNHRIGVTHSDRRTWFLHIKEVRESDRGWYMCQINTDPMKSQVGYMEIVGESFRIARRKRGREMARSKYSLSGFRTSGNGPCTFGKGSRAEKVYGVIKN
ncbi:UNVERIFIED_CONTAM: hypothetical protein PYX00_002803 [Menopon gallinae]|uniref:Ig-like domain-containing protein n=1 Tax=Menopon gallinae TaxID=328185 RepID=A0AAW2HZ38_9NEOP